MRRYDFEKERKDWRYRGQILGAILVSSISEAEGRFRFPTIQEFILSEVVNGTIEHFGGDAGKIDYNKFRIDDRCFERDMWKYLESEMKAHSKGRLNPRIRDVIIKLCKSYRMDASGPDRPYLHTELYNQFKGHCGRGGICPVVMKSSFSLPQETVWYAQNKVIPRLSNPERRDVEGIGKAMRGYIDRDLEFIGKNYAW